MAKIVVVGSISTDFVVETNVKPAQGETVFGEDFNTSFGGKGANQAVACAKLGAQTAMIGAVGNDSFGQALIDNLESYHIDTSAVKVKENTPSGSAIITLYNRDNSIIYVGGANNKVTRSDIDDQVNLIQSADMVIVQNETPVETVQRLIEQCTACEVPIILNPAPARLLETKWLDQVTYLTPNETEFAELFSGETMDAVLSRYTNKLIITLGDQGAMFHDGKNVVTVPSYKVSPDDIVDTTGAGDTFNGALAVALANEFDLADAIRFANLAGGLSIQHKGAQGGIPTLDQMKESEHYEATWHIE
ncbi:ribokinase [Dolosicoccus paucivorans]|uniref:Ribokinase n=1 Tax=Dolosicoccus paucivorans TaxID=84521 RepID=A0A2N6SPI0_9LACT|nr:ribokinase [Dolosicoccus paucivorans]PMB85066.1 ribokinase [Dolosicoccus paucivorans]PMC58978.1 ribokinase [Dolosicoccus paucivorans]